MNAKLLKIASSPFVFEIISVFIYSFYCLVFSIGAIPSFLLINAGVRLLGMGTFQHFIFLWLCFFAIYLFWIFAAITVGIFEHIFTHGFKPGIYDMNSTTFLRWMINSGLHLWAIYLVLPFLQGSNWIKVYLRIAGAKIGKNVHLNTRIINDVCLLKIEDNVIVGGDAVITCHLFDNGKLMLGKISLGEGTMVGANAYLTPGTTTCKNSKIGTYTRLGINTYIKEGEIITVLPGMSLRQVASLIRKSRYLIK